MSTYGYYPAVSNLYSLHLALIAIGRRERPSNFSETGLQDVMTRQEYWEVRNVLVALKFILPDGSPTARWASYQSDEVQTLRRAVMDSYAGVLDDEDPWAFLGSPSAEVPPESQDRADLMDTVLFLTGHAELDLSSLLLPHETTPGPKPSAPILQVVLPTGCTRADYEHIFEALHAVEARLNICLDR